MADLKKRQAEKAAETPEQKAAREKLKAELAATVIGVRRDLPNLPQDSSAEHSVVITP